MSRAGKNSKLEAARSELLAWDAQAPPVPLREMRARVKAKFGIETSEGNISKWLASRRAERAQSELHEDILRRVTAGADQCRALDAAFAAQGEPRLEPILALLKTISTQLALGGEADPDQLQLVVTLLKPVMDHARLVEARKDREFAREKFEFDAARAALAKAAELQAIAGDRSLDQDAKLEAARRRLFGELPA
jgi:hypothetical protein